MWITWTNHFPTECKKRPGERLGEKTNKQNKQTNGKGSFVEFFFKKENHAVQGNVASGVGGGKGPQKGFFFAGFIFCIFLHFLLSSQLLTDFERSAAIKLPLLTPLHAKHPTLSSFANPPKDNLPTCWWNEDFLFIAFFLKKAVRKCLFLKDSGKAKLDWPQMV